MKRKCIENLYKNLLEFKEVKVFENKTKIEIIEILKELNDKAQEYETITSQDKEQENNILAVSISWIGFKLQCSWNTEHKKFI